MKKITKVIHDAVVKEFEPQKQSLEQKLAIAQVELSNYSPYVEYAISMSCKLGSLWKDCDMIKKEKLQNLVFPQGIFYDKKIGSYRTPECNTFFQSIKRESASYKKENSDNLDEKSICRLKCG